MEKVNRVMDQMIGRLCASFHTTKLWIQDICYIDIVKLFIAAERTGNWQNDLGITAKMLDLFAVTGHLNYAKKTRLYLQIMNDLPYTCMSSSNATDPMFLDRVTDFGTEFGLIWSLNRF